MSPTAVYESASITAVPAKGTALVVGALSTAQAGTYQSLIQELEASRKVDKQMLDRLVDGGVQQSVVK